jgi:hypothetical protein
MIKGALSRECGYTSTTPRYYACLIPDDQLGTKVAIFSQNPRVPETLLPIRTCAHQYEPSPLVIEASVILTLTTVIHSPDAMKARPSDAFDLDQIVIALLLSSI